MHKTKVAFYTLGCKVNQYETNLLTEKFEKNGYIVVNNNERADIYCINSCTVTNMSDRKTRQMISRMKSQNMTSVIVLLGCYAESIKDDVDKLKNVDILIGNEDKKNAFEIIDKYFSDNIGSKDNNSNNINIKTNITTKIADIGKVKEYSYQGMLGHKHEIREFVKIEDGCNNFCSYCIIPYVRGRVRSRSLEEITEEVINLSNTGVKEIVLVGIEVASYGQDKKDIGLVDVVEKVSQIQGIERVRLSSIEPRFLTKENLLRLSKIDKFCSHFHISMQSGSTTVLKRMNRKYTKDLLLEVSKNIYDIFKKPSITADAIVGFPGETEEEFEETCKTIQKMELSQIHVFRYSKRKFTVASKMPSQVDGNVVKKRSEKIIALGEELKEQYIKKYLGDSSEVLFESYKNGYLYGYTDNYIMVKVKGESKLCGMIQDVALTSLEKGQMIGNVEK